MTRSLHHAAGSILLAFLFAGAMHAQDSASPRSDGFDFTGLDVVTRIVEQTYPIGASPSVSIANRFGPVTVEAWDDSVVHLTITVRVGAATEKEAVRTAQMIDIVSVHKEERLDVRTQFPSADKQGKGGFTVEYLVQVPRETVLTVENTFGDSHISGVHGGTTIESRYGVINLEDLAGPVRVRARGEFPLTAKALQDGGFFFLRGTQASFRDIQATLHVSNYLGSVALHPSKLDQADITAESGPIHLYLPEGPAPYIQARADFGRIESEVGLTRDTWGQSELATYETPASPQHLQVHSAFDNIYIHRPPDLAQQTKTAGRSELVQDEISKTVDLRPGQTIRIDAAPGTVVIEGAADNQVSVVARRRARVRDIANARFALEGLALRVENDDATLRVMTVVQEDMEELGVTEHGVNLTVRCPADASVELYTDTGETRLVRLGGTVRAKHGSGSLVASELSGDASLAVAHGSATVTDSTGTVAVTTESGDARIERVSGALSVTVKDGRTVVDSPGAGLTVRATGGDVRIVSLAGIQGDYDVRVEQGNISLVAPDTANATLFLNAADGIVRSAFPVTGTMERGEYRFQGRVNDGEHRVVLETRGGDVRVD